MNGFGRSVLREAWLSIGAARWFSLVSAALTFVLGALLLALVGQAHVQNTLVGDGFSAPERRTVTVSAQDGVPVLAWGDCTSLTSLREVEACWVSGPAFEVRNPRLGLGTVSAREVVARWDELPMELLEGRLPDRPGEAIVDQASARVLGLDPTGGSTVDGLQREWAVVGTFRATQPQSPLGVLARADQSNRGNPHSLSLIAHTVVGVDLATQQALALIAPPTPDAVRVSRADGLSALAGELTSGVTEGGFVVVFSVFAATWVVTAMMCLLMVRTRGTEFGRRRALGASRGWILALVLVQGALVTLPAALAGALAGVLWNQLSHHTTTPVTLVVWLVAWQVLGAATAQLPPALAASLKDPVRVLRSP
ncbi:MAG: ABC transporter permease [Propionibacteriaceae bacterium]|nr:ABC transporter permease [Propionibacteriaceae bacterium]